MNSACRFARGAVRAAQPAVAPRNAAQIAARSFVDRSAARAPAAGGVLCRVSPTGPNPQLAPLGSGGVIVTRGMAAKKGKSKGKGKGGGGGKAVDISDLDVDLSDTDQVFAEVIAAMDKALGKIKVGEVSADLLDDIMLDIDGDQLPLAAVAQVAKKDAQTLICTVFDPSLASKVETAVRDAGLGLEPARQGEVIRVAAPKMTQDYRADLTKMAKDTAEKTKAKIRRTRADGIKDIKSVSDGLGKDDTRRLEDYVSWKANAAIDAVQGLLNDKVAQIAK